MTGTYNLELDDTVDGLVIPDPDTPAGEAMAWWVERVRHHLYVGARDALPSPAATRVLRDRDLIAETPGEWAFAVRTPHIDPDTALRRNAWGLVAVATQRYAPAMIDRLSAVRLLIGDERIQSPIHVRHAANASIYTLRVTDAHVIELRPDADIRDSAASEHTTVTVGTTPPVTLNVMEAAPLLTTLTVGDLRADLDAVVVWLRTLVVGRVPLEQALALNTRTVLLKRMGDLARDAGNARLAHTIDEVVGGQTNARITRANTGVGRQFVVPKYISASPSASTPWLERHRVRLNRALEEVSTLVAKSERTMTRFDAERIVATARAAKIEDTYHSTTIEGYRITREEVMAVIEGKRYAGRSPEETERLMALQGYGRAFEFTLTRIREAQPPLERPLLAESLILDLYLELWSPSIDAGIIEARREWRNQHVNIRDSDHVPPAAEKLRGLMTQFVTHMNDAGVGPLTRAIVGHWNFVHLHPFRDGNGRVARLLMNYLLSSAGLPWTTIRADDRQKYFSALEQAHVFENIVPFAQFASAAVERSYTERG